MRAIRIDSPLHAACIELPVPVRKIGEALIQIKAMGICGSDVSAYKGKNPLVCYPLVIGHELAGVVMEIGENEKGIRAGDRVVVDPYLYCGRCYPCSLGRTNCCEDLKVLGTQIDGGMQELITHPVHLLHKIPDALAWELAPITETLCISLHSIRRTGAKRGETVAIFGAGPVGFLAALLCRDMGVRPILIDLVESRLKLARRHGVADTVNCAKENVVERIAGLTNGAMAQAVLEASGSNEAIANTFRVVSYAGRVVFTGWPKSATLLDTAVITKKELDVRGSRTANREFADCIEYIASGRIDVSSILTAVCGIGEIPVMLEQIAEHPETQIKVVATI